MTSTAVVVANGVSFQLCVAADGHVLACERRIVNVSGRPLAFQLIGFGGGARLGCREGEALERRNFGSISYRRDPPPKVLAAREQANARLWRPLEACVWDPRRRAWADGSTTPRRVVKDFPNMSCVPEDGVLSLWFEWQARPLEGDDARDPARWVGRIQTPPVCFRVDGPDDDLGITVLDDQ